MTITSIDNVRLALVFTHVLRLSSLWKTVGGFQESTSDNSVSHLLTDALPSSPMTKKINSARAGCWSNELRLVAMGCLALLGCRIWRMSFGFYRRAQRFFPCVFSPTPPPLISVFAISLPAHAYQYHFRRLSFQRLEFHFRTPTAKFPRFIYTRTS